MSRRRAEFEHRTSIFEGAYRAWSGLGGIEPGDLETKTMEELNPLTHPLKNDNRCITGKPIKKQNKSSKKNMSGTHFPNTSDPENENSHSDENSDGYNSNPGRKIYPYEPLPRSGIAHPFVQAILSPWLGANSDKEAIQVGLTTLRTWWQHRRRGESGSAITALGTERMQAVVERYVNHFFKLAYTLVVEDLEQPPRTLMVKMNELEKARKKKTKKRNREEEARKLKALGLNASVTKDMAPEPGFPSSSNGNLSKNFEQHLSNHLSPLQNKYTVSEDFEPTPFDTLYAASQQAVTEYTAGSNANTNSTLSSSPEVPKTLLPNFEENRGKIGLNPVKNMPSSSHNPHTVVPKNDAIATQSMVPGEGKLKLKSNPGSSCCPSTVYSNSNCCPEDCCTQDPDQTPSNPTVDLNNFYGDSTKTPVVLVSTSGDIQIAMSIDGITCASCVKIVETVLRGCHGNKSPIQGLLDAAADMNLKRVLIKIDKSSNAKRIAFEASRNLSMVGYTANVKEMSTLHAVPGKSGRGKVDLDLLSEAFLAVGATEPSEEFNWNLECTCPDNGVLRTDCPRHSQMNTKIFEAFDIREKKVNEYMAGCGKRYGGECTCGMACECNNCSCSKNQILEQDGRNVLHSSDQNDEMMNKARYDSYSAPIDKPKKGGCCSGGGDGMREFEKSETFGREKSGSFGRAMSALSALSIDWDNMDDFDVELDHSAHINNSDGGMQQPIRLSEKEAEGIYEGCAMMYGGICNCGPTCVCVGCPIHDKDNARENTEMSSSSSFVSNPSAYTFGETANTSEKALKRPNLRSSFLYKTSRPDKKNQNYGVTFQV